MNTSGPTQQSKFNMDSPGENSQRSPVKRKFSGKRKNTLAQHCKKSMTYACSVQASTISSLYNNESDSPEDAPNDTASGKTNTKGAARKATKSQLEGELRRLSSEVAEAREAAEAQTIKMDRKEKRMDRWRDAAHVARHERKEAIEKSKHIERERDALLKELDELKHRFSLDVASTTADVKVSNCVTCV